MKDINENRYSLASGRILNFLVITYTILFFTPLINLTVLNGEKFCHLLNFPRIRHGTVN
jgi:hypothetical protein